MPIVGLKVDQHVSSDLTSPVPTAANLPFHLRNLSLIWPSSHITLSYLRAYTILHRSTRLFLLLISSISSSDGRTNTPMSKSCLISSLPLLTISSYSSCAWSSLEFLGASSIFVSISFEAGGETESSIPWASPPAASVTAAVNTRALSRSIFLFLSNFCSSAFVYRKSPSPSLMLESSSMYARSLSSLHLTSSSWQV